MTDFQFFAPLSFFEKSDPREPGKERRIGGVISTEKLDKQGEIIIQKGLDFEPFLNGGWFNDNHKKGTTDVLGYPTGVTKFRKGERLPDGSIANANGTWAEGYLLDTPEASKIWELGRALQKSRERRLGFSIEGNVLKREGPNKNVVAKAVVRNVAITNCPVGEDTRLEVLAKSLTMGAATPGTAVATKGPQTGEGAGQVLAQQSLESEQRSVLDEEDDGKKPLSKAEAVQTICARLGVDVHFAERALSTIHNLKQRGLL